MKKKLILFTIFLSFAIVFYDWLNVSDLSNEWHYFVKHLNHLASLFGFVLLFYLYVFSSKMSLVEKNIGFDNMLKIHRILGISAVTLLSMHPILLIVFEYMEFRDLGWMWARGVGLAALIIILVTSITAVYFKQLKMNYEAWRYIHYANYVVFPLALVHVFFNSTANTFTHYLWMIYGICYVVILIGRIYGTYKVRKSPYTLVNIDKENESIWTLELKGKPLHYLPGQFSYIQFEKRHNILQSNPFTISSSPMSENIKITPKELGDFTGQISNMQIGEKVYIDAPYGVFSYTLYDNEDLVFIAGGIGITPFISMLRYMKDKNDIHNHVFLFWGNSSEQDLVFREELEQYEKELRNFKLILVMADQDDWSGEKGFIDMNLVLKHIEEIHNYKFFICGPPPLLKKMKTDLREMNVKKEDILYESFDF